MHRVGGLWKKKSKDGKVYLSGNALGIKILVWPVKEKKTANSADYTVSIEFPGDLPARVPNTDTKAAYQESDI